jgi:hypothetical protein
LTAWYRAGADVQRLLPQLSTYLGHVSIAATQVYLTMTPAAPRSVRPLWALCRPGGPSAITRHSGRGFAGFQSIWSTSETSRATRSAATATRWRKSRSSAAGRTRRSIG